MRGIALEWRRAGRSDPPEAIRILPRRRRGGSIRSENFAEGKEDGC